MRLEVSVTHHDVVCFVSINVPQCKKKKEPILTRAKPTAAPWGLGRLVRTSRAGDRDCGLLRRPWATFSARPHPCQGTFRVRNRYVIQTSRQSRVAGEGRVADRSTWQRRRQTCRGQQTAGSSQVGLVGAGYALVSGEQKLEGWEGDAHAARPTNLSWWLGSHKPSWPPRGHGRVEIPVRWRGLVVGHRSGTGRNSFSFFFPLLCRSLARSLIPLPPPYLSPPCALSPSQPRSLARSLAPILQSLKKVIASLEVWP